MPVRERRKENEGRKSIIIQGRKFCEENKQESEIRNNGMDLLRIERSSLL